MLGHLGAQQLPGVPGERGSRGVRRALPTPGGCAWQVHARSRHAGAQGSARCTRPPQRLCQGKAVALYCSPYPLFQQAYEVLGFPGKYFNDRLVAKLQVVRRLMAKAL